MFEDWASQHEEYAERRRERDREEEEVALTRVVAICGSVRMEKSNTMKILKPFLDGMEDAGASVELFFTKRLAVKPCKAEFYCWNRKPGQCHIDDDMQLLCPKLCDADILVLATPVYIPLPGEMQNLLNRMLPLMEPTLKWRKGRTRLSGFRTDVKISKFVLVSTSDWWEMANFGTVLRIVKELAKDLNIEFAGALLRPNFRRMAENREKAGKIFEASKQAGYQLAKEGKMSKGLLKVVCQPLISQGKWRAGIMSNTE